MGSDSFLYHELPADLPLLLLLLELLQPLRPPMVVREESVAEEDQLRGVPPNSRGAYRQFGMAVARPESPYW